MSADPSANVLSLCLCSRQFHKFVVELIRFPIVLSGFDSVHGWAIGCSNDFMNWVALLGNTKWYVSLTIDIFFVALRPGQIAR